MKAISIQNPWAWLITHSVKDIENRDWKASYRGRVLIHSGQRVDLASEHDARHLAREAGVELPPLGSLPRGGIVGVATIVDCVERSDSPWFVGRYGFVLKDARPLPLVECRGALGFFKVPDAVAAKLRALAESGGKAS